MLTETKPSFIWANTINLFGPKVNVVHNDYACPLNLYLKYSNAFLGLPHADVFEPTAVMTFISAFTFLYRKRGSKKSMIQVSYGVIIRFHKFIKRVTIAATYYSLTANVLKTAKFRLLGGTCSNLLYCSL